jgi:Rrf2 family protein
MKLSQRTGYAVQVLLDLSKRYHGDRVHIAQLSRRQTIPPKYLERVLLQLKKGGFVSSKMGPRGGYALSRVPEKIVLGDVLRWMEPSHFIFGNGNGADAPDTSGRDGFFGVLEEIDAAVRKVVDGINFEELRRREAEALAGQGSDIYYI